MADEKKNTVELLSEVTSKYLEGLKNTRSIYPEGDLCGSYRDVEDGTLTITLRNDIHVRELLKLWQDIIDENEGFPPRIFTSQPVEEWPVTDVEDTKFTIKFDTFPVSCDDVKLVQG